VANTRCTNPVKPFVSTWSGATTASSKTGDVLAVACSASSCGYAGSDSPGVVSVYAKTTRSSGSETFAAAATDTNGGARFDAHGILPLTASAPPDSRRKVRGRGVPARKFAVAVANDVEPSSSPEH